jgi:hypothetical protein
MKMEMTEMMKQYEAETGQSAIECIDVSTMGHRILTRVKDEFLQWADKFVKEEEDL